MRIKLQLVMCNDQGDEETVTDIITLNKNHQRIEHLGLPLAESKQLLSTLQRHLLQQQINTFLDLGATCRDCGTPLKLKAHASRSFRILFGTFQFDSPRLEHCDCTRRKTSSFRPLAALLTESVAPELLYMEAKWSSLVSYGMSLDALQDFLPLDLSLDVKTVRYDTLKVAKRLEAELGDEQSSFIEGDPRAWDLLPPPEGFFKVGMDGGYVRNWFDKKHNPTATSVFDFRVPIRYVCSCIPQQAAGGRVWYQLVGPIMRALPSLRLLSCPAMWKASWTNCGSSSPPFTTVLPGVSRGRIFLTIWSAN